MNTLGFLLFQGMLSLLLAVPAHSRTMPKNLNEIMQALGSLYQDALFDYGPGYYKEMNKYRGNDLPDGVADLTEISVEKLCLKNYPICMAFEGTLSITQNDVFPYVVTKPEDIQSCYSGFKFSECKSSISAEAREKILDFTNVKVGDFCVPGTIELGGTLNVLSELNSRDNLFAIFLKSGEILDEVTTYSENTDCAPDWDYCNTFTVDEFLHKNPACHLWAEYPTLPCKGPVRENIYSLNSFRMNILQDPFLETNVEEGIVSSRILLIGKYGLESCIEMTFNRTLV